MRKVYVIVSGLVFLSINCFAQIIDSFEYVGTHPAAVLQSSTSGKALRTLVPWNGKLYAGYGDYGANTGPIDIYSFDPDTLSFAFAVEANTEAVLNFRVLNGQLYGPATDRKSYSLPGDYVKMDSSGGWNNFNFGSASTHVYDAVRLNDSVLFMTGSQDERAEVWRSINNGQTWSKVLALTDTAISGVANDFARYYFGGIYNGKLYVQAKDFYGSMHPDSKIYDGASVTNGPSLFPASSGSQGWRPEVFAGKLVYRSWEPGGSSVLRCFDGVSNAWVGGLWVYDCFVDSNYFYALVDSGYGVRNIRRTQDLINWQNLVSAPTESRSLAILNDRFFVGTSDSKILRYTKPVSEFPVASFDSIQASYYSGYQSACYTNPCTGQVLTFASGGTAPYSYQWSNGATTANLTGLCSGMYTVTITDADGNILSDTVNVNVNIVQPITSIVTSNETCGNANGAIDLTVIMGGNGPATALWSTGSTALDITGLTAGTYSVTVTFQSTCIETADIVITNEPVTPTLIANGNTLQATPDSGYIFYWFVNGVWDSTNTTSAYEMSGDGSYSVMLGDTVNGCTSDTSAAYLVTNVFPAVLQPMVSVYPNPAGDVVHFDVRGSGGLLILHDATGRLVEQRSVDAGTRSVLFRNLYPGVYGYGFYGVSGVVKGMFHVVE